MKKKNLAFTLAEVLIVIGIIGVVAALTLPNLNHATGDKERVTKVKKIYAALNEAFDRAQAIYGDFDTWFTDLDNNEGNDLKRSERFMKRVTEFMKISKNCGFNTGCFTSVDTHWLDGTTVYMGNFDSDTSYYKVITADGMSIAYSNGVGIYIDIDGPNKNSSIFGKDFFLFNVHTDEGKPSYIEAPSSGPWVSSYNLVKGGFTAANWIIENDNADYLKADSTGKCNDSDIVLDWTTNTSCH